MNVLCSALARQNAEKLKEVEKEIAGLNSEPVATPEARDKHINSMLDQLVSKYHDNDQDRENNEHRENTDTDPARRKLYELLIQR